MKKQAWTVGLVIAMVIGAQASLTDFGLTGNASSDGWDNLTTSSGIGEVWPAAFGSNEAGSGDADLERLSGTHFAAGLGLYSYMSGSVLEISDATALTDVETIVVAFRYGENAENPSFLTGPSLTINDSTVVGSAGNTLNLGIQSVYVEAMGDYVDYSTKIYQWDVSGLGVASFDIEFDLGMHTSLVGIQMEQSDSYTEAIPEPATLMLLGSAGGALCLLRRLRMG